MNVATKPGACKEGKDPSAILDLDVQIALEENEAEEPPSGATLLNWASLAYLSVLEESEQTESSQGNAAELTIRIVGEAEMIALNGSYRDKQKTTNVLSFPVDLDAELRDELPIKLLGDVVICHPVIIAEAQQQKKTVSDHYAHMVTHGVLHLNGYDHQDDDSAERMEALEKQILAKSGIANPYS
ncbi:MAG: rRNA maturation RNase YbeY [Pseudomonadota bacterium]